MSKKSHLLKIIKKTQQIKKSRKYLTAGQTIHSNNISEEEKKDQKKTAQKKYIYIKNSYIKKSQGSNHMGCMYECDGVRIAPPD